MLSVIFVILLIAVFGRMAIFAIRAAWGLSKFLLRIVFLPLTLIVMAIGGLLHLAFILLIIAGVLSLFSGTVTK